MLYPIYEVSVRRGAKAGQVYYPMSANAARAMVSRLDGQYGASCAGYRVLRVYGPVRQVTT